MAINISLLRSELTIRLNQNSCQPFQPVTIERIEPSDQGTVEIEHGYQFRPFQHGNHDFRVRSAVAGNMARKLVHVRHDYRFAFRRGRATHTLTNLYTHARRLALER